MPLFNLRPHIVLPKDLTYVTSIPYKAQCADLRPPGNRGRFAFQERAARRFPLPRERS